MITSHVVINDVAVTAAVGGGGCQSIAAPLKDVPCNVSLANTTLGFSQGLHALVTEMAQRGLLLRQLRLGFLTYFFYHYFPYLLSFIYLLPICYYNLLVSMNLVVITRLWRRWRSAACCRARHVRPS